MKIQTYKAILIAILIAISSSSCESYLDVDPEGVVYEDDLFKNFEGYRDAMFGAYASLTENDLYGSNLSYGFIDELAQLYTNPVENVNIPLRKTNQYLYKEPEVRGKIDAIWIKSYKTISYVNNVIEHLNSVDLSSNSNYALIKGEAHALRAFLHFDIARMFCENIALNPAAKGIPYSTDFDLELPPLYDLKTIYDMVLEDLRIAEETLSNDNDFKYNPDDVNVDPYAKERALHLNKYAVWAVKARVYLWRGDMGNAGLYAEKVINSDVFSLYNQVEFPKNIKYPASKETIWAVYNNTKYDHIYDKFLYENIVNNNNLKFQYVAPNIKNLYETNTFTADNTDVRFSAYFLPSKNYRKNIFKRLLNYPVSITGSNSETNDKIEGFTLIRLPEMYYIAAEAFYNSNYTKSQNYFNKVRNSRGLADIDVDKINTKSKFELELLRERNKELWGEGHLFLEYKRLNQDIVDADNNRYPASNEMYVFPLPENEVEFGN